MPDQQLKDSDVFRRGKRWDVIGRGTYDVRGIKRRIVIGGEMRDIITLIVVSFFITNVGVRALELRPSDYDHHKPPRDADGGPVTVFLSMRINAINKVDEVNMQLVFDVYFRASWFDPRLVLPPDLVNGSMTLRGDLVHDLNLWQPDPIFENALDVRSSGFFTPFHGMRLNRDGSIIVSQMFLITMRCSMDFRKFPFDEQSCNLRITSYFYEAKDVLFVWKDHGIKTNPRIPDMLTNFRFSFRQDNVTICRCQTCLINETSCASARIRLKRRYWNHLMGSYLPTALFVVVAWASLFWPAHAIPARTVLCITALLSLISQYASIQHIIPPANYVRAIDVWFIFCICAVAASLFEYAIILRIRERNKTVQNTTKVKVAEAPRRMNMSGRPARDASVTLSDVMDLWWTRLELRVDQTAKISYIIACVIFVLVYFYTFLWSIEIGK